MIGIETDSSTATWTHAEGVAGSFILSRIILLLTSTRRRTCSITAHTLATDSITSLDHTTTTVADIVVVVVVVVVVAVFP